MERLPGPLYAIYQVHQLLTILLPESFSLSLCVCIYTHTQSFFSSCSHYTSLLLGTLVYKSSNQEQFL